MNNKEIIIKDIDNRYIIKKKKLILVENMRKSMGNYTY